MDCKDCKNYEPKKADKLKNEVNELQDALKQYCQTHYCANCPMGDEPTDCKVWQAWDHVSHQQKLL